LNKFRYIDSIRGIAIIGVIIVHCIQFGSEMYLFPSFIMRLIDFGKYGVQLFFIASAFTLFNSGKLRVVNEDRPNIYFFIRRFFRIAPMYYLGIVLWTIIFLYVEKRDHISIYNIVSNVFFVHGIRPQWINNYVSGGWSITVEVSFYLLLPLLFARIRTLNTAVQFFSLTLIGSIILNNFLEGSVLDRNLFLYYYLPNQLPVFAIGVICYFLIIGPREKLGLKSLLFLLFTAIVCYYLSVPEHIVFSIVFLILILILSRKEFKLVVNRFTCFVGKISYSMYIVHSLIFVFMQEISILNYLPVNNVFTGFINYLIRFLIVLLLTVLISGVTYKYIEVTFQNIGKKLIERIKLKPQFALFRIDKL
jgi:peptidoglycan/LPS O-acetylase OafA/YrhL